MKKVYQTDSDFRHNDDFEKRVVIRPEDYIWVDSPADGVQRMMLDRIGMEDGRSTTIVRFGPHAEFPFHTHEGGEEILVLEGTFHDEFGSYEKGSYLRNPIGTSHHPKVGAEGTTILVKLHQMQNDDNTQVLLNTNTQEWHRGLVPGLSVMPLHEFGTEHTALVKWAANTQFNPHKHWGGEEIFVIEGTFHDEHGSYPKGSWIRSPHLSKHTPFTKEDGALILVKTGHLVD